MIFTVQGHYDHHHHSDHSATITIICFQCVLDKNGCGLKQKQTEYHKLRKIALMRQEKQINYLKQQYIQISNCSIDECVKTKMIVYQRQGGTESQFDFGERRGSTKWINL